MRRHRWSRSSSWGIALLFFALLATRTDGQGWSFTEVTAAAGLDYLHGFVQGDAGPNLMSGGVAAGDYDGDGWVDLYVVRGDIGPNLLFRNRGGDGGEVVFEEVGTQAGADVGWNVGCGPAFADLDGDGRLDLLVGSLDVAAVEVFRNRGDGSFENRTLGSGLPVVRFNFGPSFADLDRDGDLDVFLPQWNNQPAQVLWRNDGDFRFSSLTESALGAGNQALLYTFTANFADFDDDGWLDLAVASDFGNSQVFQNRGDGTFERMTDPGIVIDENGMGAAIGDYDNDGDLDWFVSSIYGNPPFSTVGNRLYRNLGEPGRVSFEDVTELAGVKIGHWGWGSCFVDLDNDGWLDLFHVNGFRPAPFADDPSRLFVNQGPGLDGEVRFREESLERGIDDRRQGRGVVCFDYDRDGDIDLFVANNSAPPRLYRNDGGNARASIRVALRGDGANTEGVGARLRLETLELTQIREIRAGNHYVSQSPAVAHFGLGDQTAAQSLEVRWPDGRRSLLAGVGAGELEVPQRLFFGGYFETGELGDGWSTEP